MRHRAEWRRVGPHDWQLLLTPPLNLPARSTAAVRLPLPPPHGPWAFDLDIEPVAIDEVPVDGEGLC